MVRLVICAGLVWLLGPTVSAKSLARIIVEDAQRRERDAGDTIALRPVLTRGFARTLSCEHNPALPKTARDNPLLEMRAEHWMERLERRWHLIQLQHLIQAQTKPRGTQRARKLLEFDIPMAEHELVDIYVDYFSGRGRWFFQKWLARAERYVPIMQPILESHGLPRDLVYLAMVESGFSAHALSTASAAGFWQFIRGTGRLYDLSIDTWIDERRDFVLATHSAARYLKQLHKEFGDWHLAWAAYNAGGGRVRRALKKYESTSFWDLITHKKSLAKETRHYVPKVIAAAIVAKDHERYGFEKIQPLPPLVYDEVRVKDATDLRILARKFGMDLAELKLLNPALLHDITPPRRRGTLRVPKGFGEQVRKWLHEVPASNRVRYVRHQVERGDTLYGMARRYGTTMAVIRDFNGIGNPRALRLGQTLVVPTLKKGVVRSSVGKKKNRGSHTKRYKVRRGDTLWSIARRHAVSVAMLRAWNRRSNDQIRVGELLEIRVASQS